MSAAPESGYDLLLRTVAASIESSDPDAAQALLRAGRDVEEFVTELRSLKVERDQARNLAKNLFQMIDRETWRATGGDDGQGHYEGDYRAEQVASEIAAWKEIAS